MIVRLILSLLLAAFTMPATAAAPCHDAPAAMTGMKHDLPAPAQHDDQAVAAHGCIGCIPPSTLQPHALTAPVRIDGIDRVIVVTSFDHGLAAPPATPPPRLEA